MKRSQSYGLLITGDEGEGDVGKTCKTPTTTMLYDRWHVSASPYLGFCRRHFHDEDRHPTTAFTYARTHALPYTAPAFGAPGLLRSRDKPKSIPGR